MTRRKAIRVAVQKQDFDTAELQSSLVGDRQQEGAVVSFTGYVRGDNEGREIHTLTLEHYPVMTERSIEQIIREADERWPLLAASVVHRVGTLMPGDRIVWVGVSSSHREASFSACEFVMDYLKTRAPFWKKEQGPDGPEWVSARASDDKRVARWKGRNES